MTPTLKPKPTPEQWWTHHAKLLAAKMRMGGVKSFKIELNERGNYSFEVEPIEESNPSYFKR